MLSTQTTTANQNSASDTPGRTGPLRWDTSLFDFLGKARLSETSKGFQLDMMVLNDDFERDVLHQALKDLVSQLQQVIDCSDNSLTAPETGSVGDRRLKYTPDATHHVTPTTLNQSISRMLAVNKAKSSRSNTQEFLRPAKRRRTNPDGAGGEGNDEEGYGSSARTSTINVDRDVQMKYDIAKNPEGPLGRTMRGKLTKPEPRQAEGQGSGGVLSSMLKDSLGARANPTMPRHPGLQERFDNIEDHLRIRWVPGPPEDLRLRLKSIEEHIMKLERDYPPWASVHFNQPNRATDSSTPAPHTIVIPSHLTASADLPSFSRGPTPAPMTTSAWKRKGRHSTLLRAVMDKVEVAKVLSEGGSSIASTSSTGAGS